ncbi:MAG: hypothetical protein R3240_09410, partial [Gammaproteobacteria bacterium]|nr:hypothetical protein [Gammaproteobacteria bacterium]
MKTAPNMYRKIYWPILALLFIPVQNVVACSTCLSGDPTLTTMGAEKAYTGRKRISLGTLYRTEHAGVAGVNQRTLTEQRTTLGISYWPGEKLAIGVRIPWVSKTLEDQSLASQNTSALGDIDLDMRYYLWQDKHRAKHLLGLQAGMRLPTAEQVSSNNIALDSDVQPGNGFNMPNIGLWYGYFNFPWMTYFSSNYSFALDKGYEAFEY